MSAVECTPERLGVRFVSAVESARTMGLGWVRVRVDFAETIIAALAAKAPAEARITELEALLRERDATVAVSQELRARIDAALAKAEGR